ncbi:MAG: hypothetical protein Q8M71_08480 [Thermodesulfovibrionales bacterium]|nr:hypothetical protein [Thermodesulfovibrionales bacterium]
MADTKTMIMPITGRYNLCSKITSTMGIMLDSTDKVMKNQKMPKAKKREAYSV